MLFNMVNVRGPILAVLNLRKRKVLVSIGITCARRGAKM